MAFAVMAAIVLLLLVFGAFAIGGAGIVILFALVGLSVVVGAAALLVTRGRAGQLPDDRDQLLPTDERATGTRVTGSSTVPDVER
jgi:hypothetical protein